MGSARCDQACCLGSKRLHTPMQLATKACNKSAACWCYRRCCCCRCRSTMWVQPALPASLGAHSSKKSPLPVGSSVSMVLNTAAGTSHSRPAAQHREDRQRLCAIGSHLTCLLNKTSHPVAAFYICGSEYLLPLLLLDGASSAVPQLFHKQTARRKKMWSISMTEHHHPVLRFKNCHMQHVTCCGGYQSACTQDKQQTHRPALLTTQPCMHPPPPAHPPRPSRSPAPRLGCAGGAAQCHDPLLQAAAAAATEQVW